MQTVQQTMQTMQNTFIKTADNTKIAISSYMTSDAKAAIVVGSATGVPRRFYKHFAASANANGFNVYTLDYRGIGDSAPSSLKNYHVDYLDWARQDLAALVAHAKNTDMPVFIVGHSYGGHALGLLPNVDDVAGAYVFGAGAGWSGWMPTFEKIKVDILWGLLAPILVKIKGYMAWSVFGMGEDLPYGVYKQWKHWCQYPQYFFDDPNMMPEIKEVFARYQGVLVAANALDDNWAQPRSRDAFMHGYSQAKLTAIDLHAADYGLASIGHMGYFLKGSQALWKPIFDTFNDILDGQKA